MEEKWVKAAVVCSHWMLGGEGAIDLAKEVIKAAEKPSHFNHIYPLDWPVRKKIEPIACEVYGADGVDFAPETEMRIEEYTPLRYGNLPICMAKNHLSLSHDPALNGRPTGYRLPVRDICLSAEAGFIYPLVGNMTIMPGLPTRQAFFDIDIDLDTGRVLGLF